MNLLQRGTIVLALGATALGLADCSSGSTVLTRGGPAPTPAPSPTPSPTPTAAACAAPPPDPNTSTVTLTGKKQTITVPCFGDFTLSAVVPASSAGGVSIQLASSTDNQLGSTTTASDGTPLEYTSLFPSATIAFNSATATIATTVTSPSKIAAPHTYTVEVYVPALGYALQTITGLKPTGNSITYQISPPGGSFPGIAAIVILYQSS
jgi:hypothetical protein